MRRPTRLVLPIPDSPEKLIERAERLDRIWAGFEALGYTKPLLADELARWERNDDGAEP